ncbi:hypothetical protein ABDJ41_18705 [Pedobacter sp. ASV1-7]|uniref:hypothetical protein n=1 Tax=Pedobacter sp. ASV1-7 TaxID=3145237 RepID=UPI0032E8CC38
MKTTQNFNQTKLRKVDIDVIKGAQQTDQLEALKANALRHSCGRQQKRMIAYVMISAIIGAGLVALAKRVRWSC